MRTTDTTMKTSSLKLATEVLCWGVAIGGCLFLAAIRIGIFK